MGLALYDIAVNLIDFSDSKTDNEEIRTLVPAAGIYFIRLYPFPEGASHRDTYDLWWDDLPQPYDLLEVKYLGGDPGRLQVSGESIPGATCGICR
jgi:hypothetical protein